MKLLKIYIYINFLHILQHNILLFYTNRIFCSVICCEFLHPVELAGGSAGWKGLITGTVRLFCSSCLCFYVFLCMFYAVHVFMLYMFYAVYVLWCLCCMLYMFYCCICFMMYMFYCCKCFYAVHVFIPLIHVYLFICFFITFYMFLLLFFFLFIYVFISPLCRESFKH